MEVLKRMMEIMWPTFLELASGFGLDPAIWTEIPLVVDPEEESGERFLFRLRGPGAVPDVAATVSAGDT
jgi:hypothetical protein